jgi:N4-gp56 family major capsid protein
MAAALDRTTTLTAEMKLYYDKVFLARAMKKLVLEQGAQKKSLSNGEGKSLVFTRYSPQPINTTALSEGANPSVSLLTVANVSCTLAEHGRSFKISRFLSLTSIDMNNKEKIEVAGQSMGETINRIMRGELENGTAYFANGKKASTIKTSDTIDAADIRAVVEALEIQQAMEYDDGFFLGKTVPQHKTSIVKDSTWVNSKTYSDVKDLYRGEMGEMYQVRFLLSTDPASGTGSGASSTVTVYHTYIHGDQAVGSYRLEGDIPKLYILANPVDSNNPTGRYSLVSWAGSYVAKILNSNWIRVLKAPTA